MIKDLLGYDVVISNSPPPNRALNGRDPQQSSRQPDMLWPAGGA